MTKITLGGSAWLHRTTTEWRAAQAAENAHTRLAANVQEVDELPLGAPLNRLHLRGQLDDDWIISGVLHGTGMRYRTDWHLSRGRESEVQRERLALFRAANRALGTHYAPTVGAVVLENASLQTAGYALGYTNRSAAVAAALERLNVGLRKLAVHYQLLTAD
jgi:hypothetical protein